MHQHNRSTESGANAGSGDTNGTPHTAQQGWQRCFIALEPDAATRDALAAVPVPAAARRVPLDQLHLTVAFIGALTHERGAALIDALAPQSIPLKPAPVTGIEHWPRASHPRLTVAMLAMSDEFVALDTRVRLLMTGLGLPVDARAFRPHVTLARFRRDAPAAGRAPEVKDGLLARFVSLTLYSSTLARTGARYRALTGVPVIDA
jgi:RNA 2',3'-cyclic 3'-phosphodiesterase